MRILRFLFHQGDLLNLAAAHRAEEGGSDGGVVDRQWVWLHVERASLATRGTSEIIINEEVEGS
jgi:hypothetical protein